MYQGGGHRNASGCSVPHVVDRLPGRYYELDIEKMLNTMKITTLTIDNHEFVLFTLHSNSHRHALLSYVSQDPILIAKRLKKTPASHCDAVLVWRYDPINETSEIKYKFLSDNKEKELAFKKQFSITELDSFKVEGIFGKW